MIALVGARNASINAIRHAETLARELGEAGYVIVSGMARGIDAAAHRGAIATGTVGVIAGGIVWSRHHTNIGRLLSGTETKIGAKKS